MEAKSFHLKSLIDGYTDLTFTWDSQSGEFSGPDAKLVQARVNEALNEGGVTSDPYPTFYEVKDPTHNEPELAAIISQWWELPKSWENYLAGPGIEELLDEESAFF